MDPDNPAESIETAHPLATSGAADGSSDVRLSVTDRDAIVRKAAANLLHWPSGLPEDENRALRVLTRGAGSLVWDADGREYLDATAILGVTQIGHGRPDMAEAIARQVAGLEYASLANGFSNAPAAELAARLAELTPGDLAMTWFSLGGGEATETALKIARHYHRRQGALGRTKIIGRRGSYHGLTFGALSVCGLEAWREPFEPLLPGCVLVPAPYPYRSEELSCAPDETGRRAAEVLEATIVAEGPETVAAVIAEPVPIPGAVRVPPDDYWPAVRTVCDRYGVLLIADEILNGFGRTGRMFACEHWLLEPDILLLGKGITSGYIPLSATVVTRRIAETLSGGPDKEFLHASTYAGHPVACAAALKNLEIIENERLVENSAAMGERLLAGLQELTKFSLVGNVTGIGLLASLELVTDKNTKAAIPAEMGVRLMERINELGVLTRYMPNGLYIYPPLVIQAEEIDRIVAAIAMALERTSEWLD